MIAAFVGRVRNGVLTGREKIQEAPGRAVRIRNVRVELRQQSTQPRSQFRAILERNAAGWMERIPPQ